MESILVAGMASAFLIAVLDALRLSPLVTGPVNVAACLVGIYSLTGQWLIVPSLAAMFVSAFLGLIVRRINAYQEVVTAGRLRKRPPSM